VVNYGNINGLHCNVQIVEEFHALKPDAQLLSVEWPQYRLKILKVAEYKPTAASLLDGYSDDIEDEGTLHK